MPLASDTRQYCAEQVRGVDREKRTIEIVFSDFSLDTYMTRFDQNGWDFGRFKKNPVILAFHNDRKFVVARGLTETIRVVGQESRMTIQFPDEGKHPEADIAFHLYADGFMRGVSIGFQPTKWEDVDEVDAEGRPVRVRIFRKMRLDEVSLVALPSNENALSVRCVQLDADPDQIKKRIIALEEAFSRAPAFQPPANEDAAGAIDRAEYEKFRAYFENKQPANRESTKVLKAFYERVLKEEQPEDEVAAWKRMGEAVEAMDEAGQEESEQAKEEETETPKAPEETETPAEPAEPTTPITPGLPAEAPSAEEAPLARSLPLSVLKGLPAAVQDAAEAAVEAHLRAGKPVKDARRVGEEAGKKFLQSLSLP